DTHVMESGRASSTRPSMRCWKPSMIPRTSQPEFRASIVAAEMTEFIPGAGPPPHKIPSFIPHAPERQSPAPPAYAGRCDGSSGLLVALQILRANRGSEGDSITDGPGPAGP